MVHPVFVQTFYYSIVMLIGVVIVSFLLRGFFWKYVKVRTSFGKYVLIRIRTTLRDYFAVGWVSENWLMYKTGSGKEKYTVRLAMPKKFNPFYRCLAVTCVDIDDDKNAIVMPDFTTVPGFDAKKFEDLNTRALFRPTINSGQERVIFFMVIVIGLLLLVSLYLTYRNGGAINHISAQIAGMKGTVIGTAQTI